VGLTIGGEYGIMGYRGKSCRINDLQALGSYDILRSPPSSSELLRDAPYSVSPKVDTSNSIGE